MMVFRVSVVLYIALLALNAHGCVYKYGSSPEDMGVHGGTPWTYAFAGSDWVGADAAGRPWVCKTGLMQSPINLPMNVADVGTVSEELHSVLDMGELHSNGSNVEVINNGHTIQVEWHDGAHTGLAASVTVPDGSENLVSGLTAPPTEDEHPELQHLPITPFQFHFHTHSEHAVGGRFFPLEAHIVSRTAPSALPGCPAPTGCITVIGVFFELAQDDADNPFLSDIFDVMPYRDESTSWLKAGKTLRFDALLPSNRSYVTYAGSLTTPPCTENILWHLMLQPQIMSIRQLEQFLEATSDDNCTDPTPGTGRALLHQEHDEDHHHHQHSGQHQQQSQQMRELFDFIHRRLHEETELDVEEPVTAGVHDPAFANVTCEKMGAGENYRMVQRRKDHVLRVYVDMTSRDESSAIRDGDDIPRPKSSYQLVSSKGYSSGHRQVVAAGFFLLVLLPVGALFYLNKLEGWGRKSDAKAGQHDI